MKKLVKVSLISLALVAVGGQSAQASTEGHGNMSMAPASKMFLEKREINGYTVSFHVMEAAEGMRHGGTHNLMFKVENQSQLVDDLKINSKVVFPDGSEKSATPMKMGEWYSAGYDLGGSGEHQLMVLFKTSDGQKHFGGVRYQMAH